MGDLNHKVLAYNMKKGGLIESTQIDFLKKTMRQCLKITFEDGSNVICTPGHRFLSSDNKWVEAKDFKLNMRIKSGLKFPEFDPEKEMKECEGWELKLKNNTYKTDTYDSYIKTLIFMRLVGLIVTDGGIYKNNKSLRASVCLGHQLDVDQVINDIKILCDVKLNASFSSNVWVITLPNDICEDIASLKGIIIGRKVTQKGLLPEFLMEKNCPIYIIREFLGSMFGGDGHCPVLTHHKGRKRDEKDQLTSVVFSKTKCKTQIESLENEMRKIIKLFGRLGLEEEEFNIQKAKKTTLSKYKYQILLLENNEEEIDEYEHHYQSTLQINVSQIIKFSECVGFRYNYHKSLRLAAAVSYHSYKHSIGKQTTWVTNRVEEIKNNSKISWKMAVKQAHEELKSKEPIFNEHYSLPSVDMVTDRIKHDHNSKNRINMFYRYGVYTAGKYLKDIGAYNFFCDEQEKIVSKKQIEKPIEIIVDSEDETNTEDKKQIEIIFDSEDETDSDTEEKKSQIKIIYKTEDETDDEIEQKKIIKIKKPHKVKYALERKDDFIPTFNLKVVYIEEVGLHQVYDIQVENTENFLANGIVSHNCMIAHGTSSVINERLHKVSDEYTCWCCEGCGIISTITPKNETTFIECNSCGSMKGKLIKIPYAVKLLFQELMAMNIAPRLKF